MSLRYKGAVLSATAAVATSSSASGLWTLQQQYQAKNASAWPLPTVLVNYLVVAGGGGGGAYVGGGGGAGGLLSATSVKIGRAHV